LRFLIRFWKIVRYSSSEELASSKEVLGKVAIIEGSDSVVVGLVVADKEDLGVGLGEEICSLLDAIVQLNPSQIPS
jgi:hypothetical protein